MCNEIQGLHDKLTIVPSYTEEKYHMFVAVGIVTCARNNTEGNQLMIFSSIALYYGGTYKVLISVI